jgi:two-component system, chemotaxis family, protein-glutamate methylesterase/glutaminase
MSATARMPHEARLVVIGASAGGVSALLHLLAPLPGDYALPVLAALHLSPRHESRLAAVLGHRLAMRVCEPRDKEPLQPGVVYVAAPDYHLLVEREHCLSFSNEDPVCFARPSIDVLMCSAADAYGPAVVGVLLTGANMDGAEGLAAVKALGGTTIVQLPADAEVATMPQAAIALHAPDHVLPLTGIRQLLRQLGDPDVRR